MAPQLTTIKEAKGILLDLDHTLYDYYKCHQESIQNVFSGISKKLLIPEEELMNAFNASRKKVHLDLAETAASHNRMLYFQKMFELLDKNPFEYTLLAYNLYWDHFLSVLQLDEGVLDVLSTFKQNKKICLVTDLTVHIQHRKIQKLKLEKLLDFIVSSEEAGREKPHPYMFLLGLKKMKMNPSEVCMIGDNYSKDILGAINLSISSYWLNRDNKMEKLHPMVTEIKTFNELSKYA